MITEPGIYRGLDEAEYHAHPTSLSVSGAKVLLQNPAKFAYQRENPAPPTEAMNLGSAAHKLVLGVGADIEVIDAESYRTKDARIARDNARAADRLPLLPSEYDTVQAMATALKSSPAGELFTDGEPEVSLFSLDQTGTLLRGRVDWLPNGSGSLVVPDFKTTTDASPEAFAKSVMNFSYHMQAAWYTDLIRDLGIAESVTFLFVAQEKTPPYEVGVYELDSEALRIGRLQNRTAIDMFNECEAWGEWPGYGDGVQMLSLPTWFTGRF